MGGGFLAVLIAVLIENKPGRLGFWSFITAGETASWRLKWIAFPLAAAVIWMGARIARSIQQNPARFIGLRAARAGVIAAATVTLLMGTLIGVTVPERMRQRQYSIEAAIYARGYTLHRAFLEYRELHGTFPTDPDKYIEALRTLPDPDGSIADALHFVEPNGYEASTQLAAASTKGKSLVVRGAALRTASASSNPEPAGVSFTTYKLRLSSEHRVFGGDDDYILKDGVINKASDVTPGSSNSTTIIR